MGNSGISLDDLQREIDRIVASSIEVRSPGSVTESEIKKRYGLTRYKAKQACAALVAAGWRPAIRESDGKVKWYNPPEKGKCAPSKRKP